MNQERELIPSEQKAVDIMASEQVVISVNWKTSLHFTVIGSFYLYGKKREFMQSYQCSDFHNKATDSAIAISRVNHEVSVIKKLDPRLLGERLRHTLCRGKFNPESYPESFFIESAIALEMERSMETLRQPLKPLVFK